MSLPIPTTPVTGIPSLVEGERLTRDEFERRYDAMPYVTKAELIEGVVHMPSPVRIEQHGSPHADLIGWLILYRAGTPGVRVGASSTIRLDMDNDPQPDALLMIEPSHGGGATIDEDDYVAGGPELVAEIAASTVGTDRNAKLRAYRRNGVREYILWRIEDREIDWFVLRGGEYERLALTDGVYHSETFPGLWLDPRAMVGYDIAKVFAVLQQGMATPEHADFVARLQRAGTENS